MTDRRNSLEIWDATERVLKKTYPDSLTEEERLEAFDEDAAFCAAWIQDLLANSGPSGRVNH